VPASAPRRVPAAGRPAAQPARPNGARSPGRLGGRGRGIRPGRLRRAFSPCRSRRPLAVPHRLQIQQSAPPKGGLTQETIPPKLGIFGPLLCQNGLPAARMPAPFFLASGLNLPFSVLRSFPIFHQTEKDRASSTMPGLLLLS